MKQILRLGWLCLTLGVLASNPARADFFSDLQPKLIQARNGNAEPFPKAETSPKYTAIYYSAHWCPPCRAFTPKLVAWYKDFQPKHKDFQLVFASSDKDAKAMLEYMTGTGMPWPAVKHSEKKSSGVDKYASNGIPYLVLIDAHGKDLTGRAGNEWQPPQQVLKKIEEIVGAGQ